MGLAINTKANKLKLLPRQYQGCANLKPLPRKHFKTTLYDGSNWIQSDIQFHLVKGINRGMVFEPSKALREIGFHGMILSLV
jgi:hypothetical protein